MNKKDARRSVGKGWAGIINNLYNAKPKKVLVIQVKEKFGGLRFYVDSAPDWYFDLIRFYEHQSQEICEECGMEGETIFLHGWWLKTLCDKCKDEWDSKQQ